MIHHRQVGRAARRARARTGGSSATSRARLGAGDKFAVRSRRATSSTSCASPRRAASPTTPASPGSASTARWASSGRARRSIIPGTPRLYEGWQFGHPDGKAHFQPVDWRPAAEEPDAEYPIVLTTGRVVSQYLSGTQTRRIGALVDQYPQPLLRDPPAPGRRRSASSDGDFVRVESRRGAVVVRAQVVKTIRPDTVFVPYHWPLDRSANNCTIRAIDPISKIPEFKICAVRVSKAPSRPDDDRRARAGGRRHPMSELAFFIDYSRCIGCQACVQACEECDTHRGRSLIHLETIERRDSVQTAPQVCMHCEDPICAQVCPADAIKQTRRRRRPELAEAALHRLLELRARLPVRRAEVRRRRRSDDEVRHVLRPHQHGPAADVRDRLSLAARWRSRRSRRSCGRGRGAPVNDWQFGDQHVRTKVFVLVPTEVTRVERGGDSAQLAQATARPPADPYDVAALLEGR